MEKKLIALLQQNEQLAQIAEAIRGLNPTASPALIVEGVLDTTDPSAPVFEPDQDAPTYAEAAAFIASGKGVVYLSFGGTMEMITTVAADGMSSANATWLDS